MTEPSGRLADAQDSIVLARGMIELGRSLERAARDLAQVGRQLLDQANERQHELSPVINGRLSSPSVEEIEIIARCVGQSYHLQPAIIMTSGSRQRLIVEARQVLMYCLRESTDLSLPRIGKLFTSDPRPPVTHYDHSTIVHGCKRVARRLETDAVFALRVGRIQQQIDLRVLAPARAEHAD